MNLTIKLAAALLATPEGRTIPYEHTKLMTADQIISLFQFDHYPIRKVDGGPDEPWNLVPRFIMAHRAKTALIDVPQIAKRKRINKPPKTWRHYWPSRRIPSRPFASLRRRKEDIR